MKHSNWLFVSTLLAPIAFYACGGSTPPPEETPPAASAAPAAPAATATPDAGAPQAAAPAESAPAAPPSTGQPPLAAPPQIAWKDRTLEQKKDFMKAVVLPKMKAEFQDFDGKKFADFSCATCHGPGAKKGDFKMPNPKLPKLDPKDKFAKEMKSKPDITKFMMEKVAPDMASTLGVEPYNPDTKQGFGCFNCHTMHGK